MKYPWSIVYINGFQILKCNTEVDKVKNMIQKSKLENNTYTLSSPFTKTLHQILNIYF